MILKNETKCRCFEIIFLEKVLIGFVYSIYYSFREVGKNLQNVELVGRRTEGWKDKGEQRERVSAIVEDACCAVGYLSI